MARGGPYRRDMSRHGRCGLLVVCLLGCGMERAGEPLEERHPDRSLAALAATTLADAVVHEHGVRRLPELGLELDVLTVVNARGEKEVLAFDAAGARVELEVTLAAEDAARRARCGKLDRHLCALGSAGERVPVAIWIVGEEEEVDRERVQSRADFDRALARVRGGRAGHLERIGGEIARAAPGAPWRASAAAPVIEAELTPEEIRRVERLAAVGAIDHAGGAPVDDLDDSLALARWSNLGVANGTGVRVGILESARPVTLDELAPVTLRDPMGASSYHASVVTGIVKNHSGGSSPPGYASDASIYIANRIVGEASSSLADIDWATSQGTTAHAQSWHLPAGETSGALSARDRYLDYNTRNGARFYAMAAGNIVAGQTESEFVNHKGYNVVVVGAAGDDGRIADGVATWPTDYPSCAGIPACGLCSGTLHSTFRNDSAGQELPHLTANGNCVVAAGNIDSGTSLAAPAVAGIAAGLQERNTELAFWPEPLKAILLASPSTSTSPDGCAWRYRRGATGGCVSDGRDGTGLVDGKAALAMAENRRLPVSGPRASQGYDRRFVTQADFDPNTRLLRDANGPLYWEVVGEQPTGNGCFYFGRRLRAVLAWDSKVSCTSSSSCTDTLAMDLDLLVYEEPGHALFTQSATVSNSYEHVDVGIRDNLISCSPPGVGWYYRIYVRLNNYASLPSTESTYLGLAWQTYP